MAVIKLGVIVAEISGSIGQATFRKNNGSLSVYPKQGKQNKSFNSSNSSALVNGFYFQKWNTLDKDTKLRWSDASALFLFPDRFGTNKTLTGRQFFVKLNIQKQDYPNVIELENITSFVDIPLLDIIVNDFTNGKLIANLFNNIDTDSVYISAKRVSLGTDAINTSSLFTFYKMVGSGESSFNFYDLFREFFPLAVAGQKYQFSIKCVNSFGFVSAVSSQIVILV